MANTASLKKEYAERIAPALMKQFSGSWYGNCRQEDY